MADENLMPTSEFEQYLNTFLTKYKNNYFSKAALNSLQKTFHTHNITIQDWNTILAYLNSNVEGIDDLAKIVEHIAKYAIRDSELRDYLLQHYYTKEEVDATNAGQFPIIANNVPQGNFVNKQAWFDTEEDTDEDNITEENYETNNRSIVSNDEIEYNYEEQPNIQNDIEYNYEGA